MPIPHYGVWACHPTGYVAQTNDDDPKSPHIHLKFTDDSSGKECEAAINVKSTGKETRLVFWLSRNFSHPITEQLSQLELGFHLARSIHANSNNNNRQHYPQSRREKATLMGLDFVRTEGLVNIECGKVLPHDIPGPDNDILDEMNPILTAAIDQNATAYIFGSSYGSGIHDVHMNQGSLPRYPNGVYEDGAVLFRFDDGHWEAVFLAFASQRLPTDDYGEAEPDSRSLASILGE
ncbi:hypothetical protein NUU61_008659 [Penicillium alfredii]|uniref:DUF2278 domain-containing protein n=1 Tax=Penicillium alfredii TaxID=1506179 RepID=A0A9W9ELT1_9EURO|nr:uncharacterized protein NUU61_008659 [Penicillium alfredii]KAJ5084080.1 hypothetical protein NUU61_008659 [Penicillium alfredii]